MKDQSVLWTKDGDDENYTPAYAVTPIAKYIPSNWTIWCPFDLPESQYVQVLTKTHKVICSHISNGQDFFTYEPTEPWNVIVSNPPFQKKRQIFERALSFNKPMALLMTLTWLNDSGSKLVFLKENKQPQILAFDKRIKFVNPIGRPNNKITFSTAYYCWNLLPKDLIYETLLID